MADDLTVGAIGTQKVDITRFKKLTPNEILKEQTKGAEVPAEIVAWAQQMAALANAPDDVTYEQVDGEAGIEALNKLGIEENPPVSAEDEKAQEGVKPEEPGAVKEPGRTEEDNLAEENPFNIQPQPGQASDVKPSDEEENEADEQFSLADTELTTDPNEIRKRKERKGIQ